MKDLEKSIGVSEETLLDESDRLLKSLLEDLDPSGGSEPQRAVRLSPEEERSLFQLIIRREDALKEIANHPEGDPNLPHLKK